MSKSPTQRETLDVSRLSCCLLSTVFCALILPSYAVAQDAADAGREALEKKRFPWFDADSQSISELEQTKPDRAKSLNRGDLPEYIPPTQTPRNPNTPTGLATLLSTTTWILIAVLFLLIVGILVWFFLKMEARSGMDRGSDLREEEDIRERITQLPFEIQHTATGDFRDQAAHAARQGDFGRAIMLLFSHVLLQLDRKGLIRLKKGKTNRQYLNELKSHRQLSSYYRKVMIPFEDNFFGGHPIHRQEFEDCWGQLDSFQNQVNQSVQATQP